MQDLTISGVENGALVAVSDDGERFRIVVDESLHARIRQATQSIQSEPHKVAPREVQAYIRGGMSAHEVAAVTGASLDYIQRFEGPIIAEREHISAMALGVPVRHTAGIDPLGEDSTFGTVIHERLVLLHATDHHWASWKDPDAGWIIKLEFTLDEIEHDARWSYDPRKNQLAPTNSEAITLSQAGEMPGAPLIPRLRAVMPGETPANTARFDSDAFTFPLEALGAPLDDDSQSDLEESNEDHSTPLAAPVEAVQHANHGNNSITVSAINRAEPEAPRELHHTADLLETLRRRRSEREAAAQDSAEPTPQNNDSGTVDAADSAGYTRRVPEGITIGKRLTPLPTREDDDVTEETSPGVPAPSATKLGTRGKGRIAMPSWDEIVFGARTDDDPA